MKVTVLGINYAPELTGIGPYTTDMCEYLVANGHEVTAVTGFPYYPEWSIEKHYKGKVFSSESRNGVRIKRCYVFVRQNITAKLRILHEASFLMSSFLRLLFLSRPDVIVAVSPPLGLGMTTWLVSRLKRVPFVFHVQDLQPDAAVSLGMLPDNALVRLLFKVESFIYRKAAAVTTISQTMKDRISSKGLSAVKVAIIRNWTTMSSDRQKGGGANFRQQYGLDDAFVFLYSGNVGKKQGLEDLVDAVAGLELESAVFLIVGTGANIANLKAQAKEKGAGNIKFLPLQSKERLPDMLAAADICLVIQKRSMSDLVFPSKMVNIMAAGRPALVTAAEDTELARVVEESGCGFVAKPEDLSSLKETIEKAYAAKDLKRKGDRAAAYASAHFHRESVLNDMNDLLSKVVIGTQRSTETTQ